jgi:hypothetical protein
MTQLNPLVAALRGSGKPTLARVRALVREEGSSLLDRVTDQQIDKAILRDIKRPAVTLNLLAASAIYIIEFDVLLDKLREAIADGSVLDHEPASDKAMRNFRRAKFAAPPENAILAAAWEVAFTQEFLVRHLLTTAAEIADEADMERREDGHALAVQCAIFAVAAAIERIAEKVIDAIPTHEWAALQASRKACCKENERCFAPEIATSRKRR